MNTNAYYLSMSSENAVVFPIGYERSVRRMQMEELVQSFSSPVRSSAANRQPWSPGVIYCSEHWNECILDPEAPVKQSEDDTEETISSTQDRPNHPSGVPFWQEAFRQWNESHGVETPMQLEWLSITVSAIFPSHGQTSFQPWNMLFDLATGVTFRGLKDRRNINIERSFRWKDLEGVALSNHPQTPSVVLFKRRGRYYHGIESLMVVACFHTIRMRAAPKPSLADFQIELRRHPVLEKHSLGPFFMHGLEHSFYKFVK